MALQYSFLLRRETPTARGYRSLDEMCNSNNCEMKFQSVGTICDITNTHYCDCWNFRLEQHKTLSSASFLHEDHFHNPVHYSPTIVYQQQRLVILLCLRWLRKYMKLAQPQCNRSLTRLCRSLCIAQPASAHCYSCIPKHQASDSTVILKEYILQRAR